MAGFWRRLIERWREDRRRYEELLDEIAVDEALREREEPPPMDDEIPAPASDPRRDG